MHQRKGKKKQCRYDSPLARFASSEAIWSASLRDRLLCHYSSSSGLLLLLLLLLLTSQVFSAIWCWSCADVLFASPLSRSFVLFQIFAAPRTPFRTGSTSRLTCPNVYLRNFDDFAVLVCEQKNTHRERENSTSRRLRFGLRPPTP